MPGETPFTDLDRRREGLGISVRDWAKRAQVSESLIYKARMAKGKHIEPVTLARMERALETEHLFYPDVKSPHAPADEALQPGEITRTDAAFRAILNRLNDIEDDAARNAALLDILAVAEAAAAAEHARARRKPAAGEAVAPAAKRGGKGGNAAGAGG